LRYVSLRDTSQWTEAKLPQRDKSRTSLIQKSSTQHGYVSHRHQNAPKTPSIQFFPDTAQRSGTPHQSSQTPSSFFGVFFTALVPIPLGFFEAAVPMVLLWALVSPALANSSQKSCLSLLGPAGGAPKESQKSFFSGSTLEYLPRCWLSSPSTRRWKALLAVVVPCWMPCPRRPAVWRAWAARSASESW
jgi:hypothetical protein